MALILKDLDGDDNEFTVTGFGPSDFMIRIESFSSLKSRDDKYESNEFAAGGFNWRLIIYPNGKYYGSGDVSVYLSVANPTSLGLSWDVNAAFRIFLQNQTTDRYICKGSDTLHRFDALCHARGFSRFVLKKVFMDPCNGYLVDDSCVFGAHVSVFKPTIERVFWKNSGEEPYMSSWTISKFSALENKWRSSIFVYADKKWLLKLYPTGDSNANGRSVSVFLHLVDPGRQKVNARYTIRMKNQKNDSKSRSKSCTSWFPSPESDHHGCGWSDFMQSADISEKGLLVKDCCVLELELTVIAVADTC